MTHRRWRASWTCIAGLRGDVGVRVGSTNVGVCRTDAGRARAVPARGERRHRRATSTSSPRSGPWKMPNVHAIAGQCDDARREIAAGLALNRDNFTLERAARAHALCRRRRRIAACPTSSAARFPAATLTARIHRPVIAAALAISQRDFCTGDRVAGSGQAVRSRARGGVLAGVSSRRGVSRTEETVRRPRRSFRASWTTGA